MARHGPRGGWPLLGLYTPYISLWHVTRGYRDTFQTFVVHQQLNSNLSCSLFGPTNADELMTGLHPADWAYRFITLDGVIPRSTEVGTQQLSCTNATRIRCHHRRSRWKRARNSVGYSFAELDDAAETYVSFPPRRAPAGCRSTFKGRGDCIPIFHAPVSLEPADLAADAAANPQFPMLKRGRYEGREGQSSHRLTACLETTPYNQNPTLCPALPRREGST